ncbi:acyltransferase family protein [Ilumatobacter sp.]|uniref:acyltransferase family protein n=1 Tax=Ilumatobacter sp. TaxID=1967498 RepID=UPI003B52D72B
MTTYAPPTSPPIELGEHDARISRVPYMPGLDGMRALAVIAVMIYHANPAWLPGGFLGVEMFFVISGYLITLLIIAERERSSRVSLVGFWKRRARRLLPALVVLLLAVTVSTAILHPGSLGQLRGDVVAGLVYSSNWYQLWVGLGYTAAFELAPLRHLWSLAVEEQFYVVWPVVMVVLLGRRGTREIANVSRWLFAAAVAVALTSALAFHPGVIGDPETTPEAYWFVVGRAISKLDVLYIGTPSRSAGILLGAAFAMVWRPFAVARGPLRRRGRFLDVVALVSFVGFAWMCWELYLVGADGAPDRRLFHGGLFLASVSTVLMIAAITHPASAADRVLGNRALVWIGVRSYGLYLYHWPVYQVIRELAGNSLTVRQFAIAMVVTVAITEASFRWIETPIRTGSFRRGIRRALHAPRPRGRRLLAVGVSGLVVVTAWAAARLVTADVERSEIAQELVRNDGSTIDLATRVDAAEGSAADVAPAVPAVAIPSGSPDRSTQSPTTTGGAPATGGPSTAAPGAGDAPTEVVDRDGDRTAGARAGTDPGPGWGRASRTGALGVARASAGAEAGPGDALFSSSAFDAPPTPAPVVLVERVDLADAPPRAWPGSTSAAAAGAGDDPTSPEPDVGSVDGLDPGARDGAGDAVGAERPRPPGPLSLGVVDDPASIGVLAVPPAGPPPSLRVIAFGDSVMLGSAARLTERGVVVDAVVSRQLSASLPQLRAIADNGFLGSAVVIHLGTNGSFPQGSLEEMMAILADVPAVVLVTGKADRSWIGPNNDLLRAMPERHGNVTVLDWAVLGPLCPGDCFHADDIHLDDAGQRYYADLISRLLGLDAG